MYSTVLEVVNRDLILSIWLLHPCYLLDAKSLPNNKGYELGATVS